MDDIFLSYRRGSELAGSSMYGNLRSLSSFWFQLKNRTAGPRRE